MRVKIVKMSPDRTAGADCTYPSSTRFARFPICNYIFPIIDQCRLFYFWSWYSDDSARRLHYIPYLGSLVFILSKKKGFQSGALLKKPSSPSMEEYDLDIQH